MSISAPDERSLNVELTHMLEERTISSIGEVWIHTKERRGAPDILIEIDGIKIVIEGKYKGRGTKRKLEDKCSERIDDNICEVAIGLIYPKPLELFKGRLLLTQSDVPKALESARFKSNVLVPSTKGSKSASDGWIDVDVDELADLIRRACEEVATEDILSDAVDMLNRSLNEAHELIRLAPGYDNVTDSLGKVMKLTPESNRERQMATKMAFLALTNCSLFYVVMSPRRGLSGIDAEAREENWLSACKACFEKMRDEGYSAVFDIGLKILYKLPAHHRVEEALEKLVRTSMNIASSKALLRHDLMGRIYHRLLRETAEKVAKHKATYYTSVPAAHILARLAYETDDDSTLANVRKEADISDLKIIDMAIGTGTLESAISDAIYDNIIRSRAEENLGRDKMKEELNDLHKTLMESCIYGFDVLHYATHLALTTLSMRNPDVRYRSCNLFTLPLGGKGKDAKVGSAEFLDPKVKSMHPTPLFTGKDMGPIKHGLKKEKMAEVEMKVSDSDLVIMNPPFARSCADNLLFGDLPEPEKKNLQRREKEILREAGLTGIGPAGFGAAFTALADKLVKPGGKVALVLPKAFLLGSSWEDIRKLMVGVKKKLPEGWETGQYHIQYIVLSHEKGGYNFSENADISECLIVAKKLRNGEELGKCIIAKLRKKPKSSLEAIIISRQLTQLYDHAQRSGRMDILTNPNGMSEKLRIGGKTIGEAYSVPHRLFKRTVTWGPFLEFYPSELNSRAYDMLAGRLRIPFSGLDVKFPMDKLNSLGNIGLDVASKYGVFRKVDSETPVPAFWGRKADMLTSIEVNPNTWFEPKPSRIERAREVAKHKSHLLIPYRIRVNTSKVTAVYCTEKALGNVWWEVKPYPSENADDEKVSKIWALWLNSTFGLLLYLSHIHETREAWMEPKKKALKAMPILDIKALNGGQVKKLLELYDEVHEWVDEEIYDQLKEATRGEGLRAELDKRLIKIITEEDIELEDLRPLYLMLCQEPLFYKEDTMRRDVAHMVIADFL